MKLGTTLGRLRIRGRLGSRVSTFLAGDAGRRGRPQWVIKCLPFHGEGPLGEVLRPDFLDLISVIHDSLAGPIAFETDPRARRPYLLRPYVEGSEILPAVQGLAPAELFPWLLAAAEALEVFHRFGFVHRNLKPSNLIVPRAALFSRHPRGPKVVLCDPAWWSEEAGAVRDATFDAPELHRKESASFSTDLYALGVIFYRILAGRELKLEVSGFPISPGELNREVPTDLDRLVLKLLGPDPDRRYREVAALIDDLRRLSGIRGPVSSSPPECFLGRREELARASRHLSPTGRPAALAVIGEAGSGKSSFLRRTALEGQLLGFRTVSARCYPEKAATPSTLRSVIEQLIQADPQARSRRRRYRHLLAEWERGGGSGAPDAARRIFLRGLIDLLSRTAATPPHLLLIDEVHLADSLTIAFLAGVVREIAGSACHRDGPPSTLPHLAVCFRTESPFRPALGPLLEALEAPGAGHLVLPIGPLPARDVETWLDRALANEPDLRDQLKGASGLGGHPFAIREAIRLRGSRPGGRPSFAGGLPSLHKEYLSTLSPEERALLDILAVVGRPASPDLLGEALDCPPLRLQEAIARLLAAGTLSREGGTLFFQHGSFHQWLSGSLTAERKGALHRRIAEVLARRGEGEVEEIADHWRASDSPAAGVGAIIAAARHLAHLHEDRRALAFYQEALDSLPAGEEDERRSLAEEASEAYSRTGQHRRGIEILERLLKETPDARRSAHLHGRLGVFHHRAGEIGPASRHLKDGLALLGARQGLAVFRERVRIEAEMAEIASYKGDHDEAEAISARILAKLERRKEARVDRELRRLEMVLLETLANLRLRNFRSGEARELFEKSLAICDELAAHPEKGLILNNLGILHNQENRLAEAVECYRRAEKIADRLGDDPVLVNIDSNLAVLHAKLGRPEEAAEALRRASHHLAGHDSSRIRFLSRHCAGMVDLYFGRYASGIESFKAAIELGLEVKDHHVAAFDLIYLGECHLFRGEMKAARAAFERALGLHVPTPHHLGAMAGARMAVLAALNEEVGEARGLCLSSAAGAGCGIPFIEAWNRVFRGWARRLLGLREEAGEDLEGARSLFAQWKVPAGEIHAELELAALAAEDGNPVVAENRLRALRRRHTCGRGALKNPMLSARLLAYQARLVLDRPEPEFEEAAGLLNEAESYLIGHRIQDLEVLVRGLRRRLRRALLDGQLTRPLAIGASDDPAEGLAILTSFLGPAADLLRRFEGELGEERVASLRRQLAELEGHLLSTRRALESRDPPAGPPVHLGSIIGRSAGLRKVRNLIRQVAPAAFPVLITGETGTGKELVARAIHFDGPRRRAPFVSQNCAAIPAELFEAELFGHLKGAFSGADRDRSGLLHAAMGGTFLFDEIGEMPLSLQGKLLRILDQRRFRPLGGEAETALDVRFLFATNRRLQDLIDEGKFRGDLFYRLSGFQIDVPPLRDRLEDLPELAEHFRRLAAGDDDAAAFDACALRALAAHPWPGNVRELKAVVTRLVISSSGSVGADQVQRALDRTPGRRLFPPAVLESRPLNELQRHLEKEFLLLLRSRQGGSLKAMARVLGISRQALYKRFKVLGIGPEEPKD